jgi:hypothetical protein
MEEGAEDGRAILPLILQIYMNYIYMKELRTFQQVRLKSVINFDQHRPERMIPVRYSRIMS